MDRESSRLPTRIRSVAHFTIGWNVQRIVIGVNACVVIRRMAAGTSVWRIGIVAVVTSIAIIRNRNMRSSKGINRIVIKSRGRPSRF